MDKEKQIEYWVTASNLDWKTANDIYDSEKNYHFCLFLCHLVIEKLLKAIVVKVSDNFPPKSHNLLRLAEIAKIEIIPDDIILLNELNQFQIDTRYPDEKFILYKKADREFTYEKIKKVEKLREWLISKV